MLEKLKEQLVEIAKNADSSGLCKHKSGNFSIRDKKTGYIVITPTGLDRKELNYHDICVVDIDGNEVEIETDVKPTSEILMHIAIYKNCSYPLG
jgi:L-ribulose-5-phosphate 4-epimerase